MNRALASLLHRVVAVFGRGTVIRSNETSKVRELQVAGLAGERFDRMEHFQEYGFTSRPHPGVELAFGCVAGNRDHPIAVASEDRRYRITTLAEGEVAIYDDLGNKVVLKRTGIEVEAPLSFKIVVGASSIVVGPASVTITSPAISFLNA